MNPIIKSFPASFPLLREINIPSLTPLQKTILAVSSAVFCCFAIFYILRNYYWKNETKVKEEKGEDGKKPSLLDNSPQDLLADEAQKQEKETSVDKSHPTSESTKTNTSQLIAPNPALPLATPNPIQGGQSKAPHMSTYPWQLSMRTLDPKTLINIEVNDAMTVSEVLLLVNATTKIPIPSIRLIWAGFQLNTPQNLNRHFGEFNIKNQNMHGFHLLIDYKRIINLSEFDDIIIRDSNGTPQTAVAGTFYPADTPVLLDYTQRAKNGEYRLGRLVSGQPGGQISLIEDNTGRYNVLSFVDASGKTEQYWHRAQNLYLIKPSGQPNTPSSNPVTIPPVSPVLPASSSHSKGVAGPVQPQKLKIIDLLPPVSTKVVWLPFVAGGEAEATVGGPDLLPKQMKFCGLYDRVTWINNTTIVRLFDARVAYPANRVRLWENGPVCIVSESPKSEERGAGLNTDDNKFYYEMVWKEKPLLLVSAADVYKRGILQRNTFDFLAGKGETKDFTMTNGKTLTVTCKDVLTQSPFEIRTLTLKVENEERTIQQYIILDSFGYDDPSVKDERNPQTQLFPKDDHGLKQAKMIYEQLKGMGAAELKNKSSMIVNCNTGKDRSSALIMWVQLFQMLDEGRLKVEDITLDYLNQLGATFESQTVPGGLINHTHDTITKYYDQTTLQAAIKEICQG